MHHKRGRPKNRRAGCLFCKPWKANGRTDWPVADLRRGGLPSAHRVRAAFTQATP